MANVERELPLFPLGGTVLFPGMNLPLQIFENRYLQMMADITQDDSRFGVVLIKEGKEVGEPALSFDVGTVAQVFQREDSPDGRIILVAEGQQRFRTLNIVQQRPYIIARVELLPPEESSDMQIAQQVRGKYIEYAQLLAGMSNEWMRDVQVPEEAAELSYLVAQSLDASMMVKQGLLEMDTVEERLLAEVEILDMTMEHVRQRVRREGPSQRFSTN
jgi:Lon protease-like protein